MLAWYYDYLFKRFGRHGLDGRDLRIDLLTHPVRLADIATAPSSVLGLYYINAFYSRSGGRNGQGLIVFGEGAPNGFLAPNLEVKPFSAAFDVRRSRAHAWRDRQFSESEWLSPERGWCLE